MEGRKVYRIAKAAEKGGGGEELAGKEQARSYLSTILEERVALYCRSAWRSIFSHTWPETRREEG